ncbi:hypothetical protein [Oscillibacter sp.]|uniref:hypothetical protein n=1 Tax=Oscillibacter sp. TaxID=1945593 RepID=UPI0028A1EEED|nr:hypothetical protein [Oscillibacter sp.]
MPDYQAMYYQLFNAQTDAIRVLQTAQKKTEQMYIDSPKPDIVLLSSKAPKESINLISCKIG